MMKMSGRIMSCCAALLLALTSVSAVQSLNSINDLKKINFGHSVPRRSLVLLHWFANMVDINNNNVIRLTFNQNSDYGSHYYSNFEGLLPPGHRYYTIGNFEEETTRPLPSYVIHPPGEYVNENRGRIIIRVRGQIIDRVYMTQHYHPSENQGTIYDPNHTYQITTNLLRQIREFSLRDNQQPLLYLRNRYGSNADDRQFRQMTNTWGKLACVGLLLLIVTEKKQPSTNTLLLLILGIIFFICILLASMRRV